MKKDHHAQNLIDFIFESPSVFHVIENVVKTLLKNGFKELNFTSRWKLSQGGKYFIKKNDSALVAFELGSSQPEKDGFRLVAAHTDSPGFRIKGNPEVIEEDQYLKLNTEVYGGPILNTWFDRPLSLAGRVAVQTDNPFQGEIKLVNIDRPLLVIPNLAIHLNREINQNPEISKQKDLLPLLSMVEQQFEKKQFLLGVLAEQLAVKREEIIDFDLFLYEHSRGSITGLNNEFISSGKLDDLAMVQAALLSLVNTNLAAATKMIVLFDHEEIGSRTGEGADSPTLTNIMERITLNLGKDREDFFRALANSFMISADMAHAVHPNRPEKHDPTNKPIINQGPVIKVNANGNYTSDSKSIAVFKEICSRLNVPVQMFYNHSDQRGGSTIGPISNTQLGIQSIDIGNPMLAMHSIRELAGVDDHLNLIKVLQEYFLL